MRKAFSSQFYCWNKTVVEKAFLFYKKWVFEILVETIKSKNISLSADEIESLPAYFTARKLAKKEYLFKSGDICDFEAFVADGCLRQFHLDREGNERVLFFVIEGWWVSDTASFLYGTPANFSIDAMMPSEVLLLTKENKEKLFAQIPQLERYNRIFLEEAHALIHERIVSVMRDTAEERYLKFIQNFPRTSQRVPLKQIAAFLGITPEFLSQIRRKLADGEK